LWTRDVENEVLAMTRELGIGFVAYSPLGRGFLTGRWTSIDDLPADDWRRDNPRFQGENFQKNLDLVARLEGFARTKGCTTAQLALSWVLSRGDDIVPIPGTTRGDRLDENAKALDVRFTQAELAELDAIAPQGVASGKRYTESSMRAVDR
jgi:aryl-alcohol dehydrogenase-like predicted oxidoreductase